MSAAGTAIARFAGQDQESLQYLQYHQRRYDYLLEVVSRALANLRPVREEPLRVLDVGIGFELELLRERYPEARINTLGFFDFRFPVREGDQHFEFDLNQAGQCEPEGIYPHDLILLAEVIEHLPTSPLRVLSAVRKWLRPGGLLLIQTPNPVSLGRRVAMLRGISPFEIPRDNPKNPGHYCEYTRPQIRQLCQQAGFEVLETDLRNYFGHSRLLYNLLCLLLPGELSDGITLLARAPHLR